MRHNHKNKCRIKTIVPDLAPEDQASPVIIACEGKIRYESKRAALQAGGKRLRAYRCPHHGCYHLSSAPPKKRSNSNE